MRLLGEGYRGGRQGCRMMTNQRLIRRRPISPCRTTSSLSCCKSSTVRDGPGLISTILTRIKNRPGTCPSHRVSLTLSPRHSTTLDPHHLMTTEIMSCRDVCTAVNINCNRFICTLAPISNRNPSKRRSFLQSSSPPPRWTFLCSASPRLSFSFLYP